MRPPYTEIDIVEVLKLHHVPNIAVTSVLGWRLAWRCCCAVFLTDKKNHGVIMGSRHPGIFGLPVMVFNIVVIFMKMNFYVEVIFITI